MRKLFILAIILLAGGSAFAQPRQDTNAPMMYDMSTQDAFTFRYTEYDGSPLLYDEWKAGKVKLKDGRVVNNFELNYDIPADLLLFRDKDGSIRKFTVFIQEFSVDNALFRAGYQPSDNRTDKSFYQVLADGKAQYLKWVGKTIVEDKPYGATSMKKRFSTIENFFIARDGKIQKIRKDKKAVLEALGDKTAELEKFVASEKPNLKSDAGIIALLSYYNSL